MKELTFGDHSRIFDNNEYIYPVLSRRSGGLSIGVNLNTNNACNYRCVYCQVENLIRGAPTPIDTAKLEHELDELLDMTINGDFIDTAIQDQNLKRINDISISGNGEPTLSNAFTLTVDIITRLKQKYNITNIVKTILITNGSHIDDTSVQSSLKVMNKTNSEVWFKVDGGTTHAISQINQVNLSMSSIKDKLYLCGSLCDTYIQSCFFKQNGNVLDTNEIKSYVDFVVSSREKIKGVLLYSTARTPMLKEGVNITPVDIHFLENIAHQLASIGIMVRYYV